MADEQRARPGYLREIEVKLWVEERELEALPQGASQATREALQHEIDRLRALARSLRGEPGASEQGDAAPLP